MNRIMIPINEQAIADMKEEDKLPYAPEGSFVLWYLDAMESIKRGKSETNEEKGDDE